MYHLHSIKEITSDECKTLTKISTCNLSQQFPQTSTHFGHNKIRNLAFTHFQGPSLPEGEDCLGGESTQEGDEGLFISSFLEEALGRDGNLQIKMAHTMQAQEKHDRKCFICQSPDHLMRDHYQGKNGKGPLQPKGPPQNKSAHRWPQPLCLVKQHPTEPLQSEGCAIPKPRPLLLVYQSQKFGQGSN